MIFTSTSGNYKRTEKWLKGLGSSDILSNLDSYGRKGVAALAAATPVDTGLTARGWQYRIENTRSGVTIEWYNTNVNNGSNIAILLQYGHGTGTGGFVQGIDYINPATRPVFDEIASEISRRINSL